VSTTDQPGLILDEGSPGRVIAQARTVRKLTTAEVAQSLKFGVKQIEALEADDYARLPGATFVRGMIRSYAKLLQIEAEPLLSSFSRRHIPSEVTVDLRAKKIPFPDGHKRASRIYMLLTIAILVAAGSVAYEWRMHPGISGEFVFIAPSKPAPNPEPMAPGPKSAERAVPTETAMKPPPTQHALPAQQGVPIVSVPKTVATPASTVRSTANTEAIGNLSGLRRIQLQFDQDAWVEIKQADGRILLSQLNAGGARRTVSGLPPFEVIIGNAPSVHLTYNNEPVDLRPYFKVDVARLTLE
jgi:cytoskeleton protein RodZ